MSYPGNCEVCGRPIEIGADAWDLATTLNGVLLREGKAPMDAGEIARCDECYLRRRKQDAELDARKARERLDHAQAKRLPSFAEVRGGTDDE